MRLVAKRVGELYRLTIDNRGVRHPLLAVGERPSWAGGWAGEDGVGGYPRDAALEVLLNFGLSVSEAQAVISNALSASATDSRLCVRQQR